MAMEDLSSLFCYQENVDELKQKLFLMTCELQSTRMQAEEEARKNKENMESMKQLLHLLQVAHKERDEARNQLQKLLRNKLSSTVAPPILSPESSLMNNNQGRTSSGVTESNSLSDATTYNNSGDPLYDVVSPVAAAVTAVDTGNVGFAQHNPHSTFIQDFGTPVISAAATPPKPVAMEVAKVTDRESQIIYNLAKGRPLPQKGKLLQSVMDAGPLLQTLMVAGPLPRWRNPPPLQPLQAPPVAIGGFDGDNHKNKPCLSGTDTGSHLLKRPYSLLSGFAKVPCGSSQVLTSSVLNFTVGGGFGTAGLAPAGGGFGSQMIPAPKRQRIQ